MSDLYVPLDVNAPDDPKLIAAGDHAELVFYRSLCLAKRRMSDGLVAREQLKLIGATARDVTALVRVGLWEPTDAGWMIASYLKRNKPRAQIEAERKTEADRKKAYRERRSSKDTPGDVPPDTGVPSGVTSNGTEKSVRDVESESPCSEDTVKSESPAQPDTYAAVLARIADRRMKDRQPADRGKYREAIVVELDGQLGDKLRRLIEDYPGAPLDTYAGALLGEPVPHLKHHRRIESAS